MFFFKNFNFTKDTMFSIYLKPRHDEFFRQGYFGGRCEVFGNAKKDELVHHFDFSGMYSEVMKQNFCFGNFKKKTEFSSTKIAEPGFYLVEVKSPKD